jgi:hypothetical protein
LVFVLKSIAGGDANANAGAGADAAPANGAVNDWDDSCFLLLIIIFNKVYGSQKLACLQ